MIDINGDDTTNFKFSIQFLGFKRVSENLIINISDLNMTDF